MGMFEQVCHFQKGDMVIKLNNTFQEFTFFWYKHMVLRAACVASEEISFAPDSQLNSVQWHACCFVPSCDFNFGVLILVRCFEITSIFMDNIYEHVPPPYQSETSL